MFALFRRSQKIWLWALVVIVVVTFVIGFGPGSINKGLLGRAKPGRIMGAFNNVPITDEDLRRAVAGARIELLLKGYKPQDLNKPKELEELAWRRIIMVNEAKAAGIRVSPEELEAFIRSQFFKGEQINPLYYRQLVVNLRGPSTSTREFEEHLRDLILKEKHQQYICQTVIVTDEDVRQAYEADQTLIKLAYIPFYQTNYPWLLPIGTNDLAEFWAKNQEEFRVPAKADIVVALAKPDHENARVTPEDIANYYDDHKRSYEITNKTDKAGATNTADAAAATNLADTAAADTNDTDLSAIEYEPLATVSNSISTILLEKEALNLARRKIDLLSLALMTNVASRESALREKAEEMDLVVVAPGQVSMSDTLPGISNSTELIRQAFRMKPGELSDILVVPGDGAALMLCNDVREAYLPELTNIEDRVRADVLRERSMNACFSAAQALQKKMSGIPGLFTNAAAALKLPVKVSLPFNRETGCNELECPPEIVVRLFAYPVNVSVVVPSKEGCLLVCPVEILDPDFGLMQSETGTLRNKLTMAGQGLLYEMWFNQAYRKLERRGSLVTEEPRDTTGGKEPEPDGTRIFY